MAEVNDVIRTLIAEAYGEGPEGMRRVAETILNRAAIRGISPEEVVRQPAQFTGLTQPGEEARRLWGDQEAIRAAQAAYELAQQPGDPTGGADHYYAHNTIDEPWWAPSMTGRGQHGGHTFLSSRPIPPGSLNYEVGTVTDTVPPRNSPYPVTPTPNLNAMRAPPPLPRPRPNQSQMSASDSLAFNPVNDPAVPSLNAGQYTGPAFTHGYPRTEDPNYRQIGAGAYSGEGDFISFGTDDGLGWDRNGYDGPQGQVIRNVSIRHSAPDTPLGNFPESSYKAGSRGVASWRGGHVQLENVLIERFEYNYFAVQSDFDKLRNIQSRYSRYGIYAGPRSDQMKIDGLYTFYCDQALVVDEARGMTVTDLQLVQCGTGTLDAIDVRPGSEVTFYHPWLEAIDAPGSFTGGRRAFIGAGVTPSYGSDTNPAEVAVTIASGHQVGISLRGTPVVSGPREPRIP
jgi:hypothetical protein